MKLALVLAPLALVTALATFAGLGAAAPAEPSAAPYGAYTVRLGYLDPDVPTGVWRLTLRRGRYTLLSDAAPIMNQGRLSVSGDVLTFTRETLCPSAVGRYRFRVTGGKLRLRVIGSDRCSGNDRTVVLTTKPWTRRS